MPLYSFRCPACGKRFEEILTVARKDEAVCPDCGRKAERQVQFRREAFRRLQRPLRRMLRLRQITINRKGSACGERIA